MKINKSVVFEYFILNFAKARFYLIYFSLLRYSNFKFWENGEIATKLRPRLQRKSFYFSLSSTPLRLTEVEK